MLKLPTLTSEEAGSLTDRRGGRLLLFGLMYFVQGTMFAYFFVFNNLYLRANQATASHLVWLNGLLVTPFVLKIGIGMISDKVSLFGRGHRVPYMALGLLMTSGGALAASFIPPVEQFPLFLGAALLIALGFALFDAVNDGMAIDVTPENERFLVQGAMAVGRSVGFGLMPALYGRIIDAYGWQIVFWMAAAFPLLPLPVLRRVREPAQRSEATRFDWSALRRLWRPEIGLLALYGILYAFVAYGANAIVPLFAHEELEASLIQVGDIAAVSGIGMMIGGLVALLFGKRLSIWQQAMYTTVAVTAALFFIGASSLDSIVPIALLWGACLVATELVFVTLAMIKSDPRMGASTFAIFMAISNIGTGAGQATTTGLIDNETIELRGLFIALAVINLLSFPLLLAMRAGNGAEETGAGQPAPLWLRWRNKERPGG